MAVGAGLLPHHFLVGRLGALAGRLSVAALHDRHQPLEGDVPGAVPGTG
ncbi:hypothetical protein SDC9_212465 [bioreactor metagenome]|uniref:Uncharacterized protein n=1 Tax=bioreactor metagenome TaxID=1076179 RepID=A0A645JPM4_9ZZZZ